MTTRAQPGGIERQLDVFRHLAAAHGSALGVHARVVRAGTIAVGDAVAA